MPAKHSKCRSTNSSGRSNAASLSNSLKKYAVLLFMMLGLINRASAYTLIATSTGDQPIWPSMPVSFSINQLGSPQITNGSDFAAVQAAFQTWQNVGIASISLQYGGTTPVSTVGQDGLNVITFVDDSVPLGSDTVASTFSFLTVDGTGSL